MLYTSVDKIVVDVINTHTSKSPIYYHTLNFNGCIGWR